MKLSWAARKRLIAGPRRYWWPVWFTEQLTTKPVPVRMLSDSIELVAQGVDPIGILREAPSPDVIVFDAGKNFGEEKEAAMGAPPPTRKAS